MRIRALGGGQPHPDYGGWRNFLNTCELRDEHDGVKFYGSSNCNYILWPNGLLVQNFGYHGRAVMNMVREKGAEQLLTEVREAHAAVKQELEAELEYRTKQLAGLREVAARMKAERLRKEAACPTKNSPKSKASSTTSRSSRS